ncbi:hypothetical protein C7212DRAFT_327927, partial [Tuber magnatum]
AKPPFPLNFYSVVPLFYFVFYPPFHLLPSTVLDIFTHGQTHSGRSEGDEQGNGNPFLEAVLHHTGTRIIHAQAQCTVRYPTRTLVPPNHLHLHLHLHLIVAVQPRYE